MADIWPVFEGREPTRGEPWATLPLEEAVDLMRLSPVDRLSAPDRTPRFGPRDRDLWWLGYRHVIVEISAVEAKGEWQAGFYRSPLPPREALNKLLWQALRRDLGPANVIRVEVVGAVDAENEGTFKLMVVLAPDAVSNILADASIAAFGNLLRRLDETGIKGTPTLQYVTGAELAEGEV